MSERITKLRDALASRNPKKNMPPDHITYTAIKNKHVCRVADLATLLLAERPDNEFPDDPDHPNCRPGQPCLGALRDQQRGARRHLRSLEQGLDNDPRFTEPKVSARLNNSELICCSRCRGESLPKGKHCPFVAELLAGKSLYRNTPARIIEQREHYKRYGTTIEWTEQTRVAQETWDSFLVQRSLIRRILNLNPKQLRQEKKYVNEVMSRPIQVLAA